MDRLISFQDALERIGRRTTAGYADVAAGRLQIVKNGRRTFVLESEISRYIAALPKKGRTDDGLALLQQSSA